MASKYTPLMIAALVLGLAAGAPAYTIVTLSPPGDNPTSWLYGISDAGAVAGIGWAGAFIYDDGIYTPIAVPGGKNTSATDVNDAGHVVGRYHDGSGYRAYVYADGTYTTLAIPGAIHAWAQGINNAGIVVGYYVDSGPYGQSFVYDGQTVTPFNYPGALGTVLTGINDAGHMVGYATVADGNNLATVAFVYDGATFTSLAFPGASITEAWGINDTGEIVGQYRMDNERRSFVYDGAAFTTLSVPNASLTWLYDINDSGRIVGFYEDAGGVNHGVLFCKGPCQVQTAANYAASGDSEDPINTFTGELFKAYPPDLSLGGPLPLSFARYYSSGLLKAEASGSLGGNWRHNFEWSLTASGAEVTVVDHRGRLIRFAQNGSLWDQIGANDVVFQLSESAGLFRLLDFRDGRVYAFDASGRLSAVEDEKGNAHSLTYDAGGHLVEVTDGLGRTLTFSYADPGGHLVAVTDGMRTITFTHTGNDLTTVTDALNNPTVYQYATGSRMVATTPPAGASPSYTQTWNSRGQVNSQTDAGGNTTTLTYDGFDTVLTDTLGSRVHRHTATGELSGSRDRSGAEVTIGSDDTGRRNAVTDRLGDVTALSYHAASGKLASKTHADGSVSSVTYSPRPDGAFTRYDLTGITHADGSTESFLYDDSGNLITLTDRSGDTASATYNHRGQPLTTTNRAGGVTTYTYNTDATPATRTDPGGRTTAFGYDTLTRLNRLTYADDNARQFTYDAEDHLLSSVDENGHTTAFAYDANGNLKTVTDALNHTTSFAYDGNDRLISVSGPLGNAATTTYNALGRPETATDENNHTTTAAYDVLGRLTTVTFPAGNSRSFSYDAEGVLASVTDGLGRTTSFTTDSMGRVTQTLSPLGHSHRIAYDAMGRVVSTTDPLNQTTTYQYDTRGLLSEIDLPGGIGADYTRNSLGLITQVLDPNGNAWLSGFDNQGLRTSRTDPLGSLQTTAYDLRGRPGTITYADGVEQTLAYDPAGNLVHRSYSGGGPVLNYTYDANNRLTSADGVTLAYDANGKITTTNGILLSRDPGGRILSMTLATGKTLTYAYDANDNLVSVSDWTGAGNEATTFTYDANDRLVAIVRPPSNGIQTTFTFDDDGRLAAISDQKSDTVIHSVSLTRDADGRITQASRLPPVITPGAVPEDMHWSFDAAGQVDTTGFGYDARGRLTHDGTRTYMWDATLRLQSVTAGGVTVTYTYDALGQRLSRSEAGKTRRYVWNAALGLNSVSIERDAAGDDLRYFIHTPAGALLYTIDAVSDARHFYHYDERGNTVRVSDDAGKVVGSYAYSPYGRVLASDGLPDNAFTWQGKYGVMDEGNGLYYLRARYYDSRSGRFISRDPVKAANPLGINPYQYAFGNPMRFSDASGLEGDDEYEKGWDGKYERGMESLKDVAFDFFKDKVMDNVPGSDFFPDAENKDNPGAVMVQITHGLLKTAVNETAGKAVSLGELGTKIGLIIFNETTKLELYKGKLDVELFHINRKADAESKAKQVLTDLDLNDDTNLGKLSSMDPLSRSILRKMALEKLKKVEERLKKDQNYDPYYLSLLKDRWWFLVNAVAGDLVPGEAGWEPDVEPSSNREAAQKPSLSK